VLKKYRGNSGSRLNTSDRWPSRRRSATLMAQPCPSRAAACGARKPRGFAL